MGLQYLSEERPGFVLISENVLYAVHGAPHVWLPLQVYGASKGGLCWKKPGETLGKQALLL